MENSEKVTIQLWRCVPGTGLPVCPSLRASSQGRQQQRCSLTLQQIPKCQQTQEAGQSQSRGFGVGTGVGHRAVLFFCWANFRLWSPTGALATGLPSCSAQVRRSSPLWRSKGRNPGEAGEQLNVMALQLLFENLRWGQGPHAHVFVHRHPEHT